MSVENLSFIHPQYFNLFWILAIFIILWLWRIRDRRLRIKNYIGQRLVPVKEKYLFLGRLAFWGALILALGLSVVALARPQSLISVSGETSVDLIVLMDGSASMRVQDLKPDRWQRSMGFIRTLTETLSWKGDRIALALFAHKAHPYVRLSNDPNVVLFFIDHLKDESPLRIEDPKTWDTNIAEGVYWGVKIIRKDLDLYGDSKNPRAFILVSDGQAWSGEIEAMFKLVKNIGPVYVIGVGTTTGGIIPEKRESKTQSNIIDYDAEGNPILETTVIPPPLPVHSSIDRQSLRNIAITTGGEYFELGSSGADQLIALKIIDRVKSGIVNKEEDRIFQELYWQFILASAVFVGIGVFYLYR